MSSIFWRVVFATLVLPLTAGNRRLDKKYPDASISMTLILITWLSFMLTVIPVDYKLSDHVSKSTFVHGILIFNILISTLACVVFVLLWCCRGHRGHHQMASFTGRSLTLKLRVFFLWMFFLGVVVKTVCFVWRDLVCLGHAPYHGIHFTSLKADTVYNLVLTLFSTIQTSFISKFVGYKFNQSTTTSFCMLAIIGANLTVWIHTFETYHRQDYRHDNRHDDPIDTCFHGNESFVVKGNIFWFADKSTSIIETTVMQFALLSITLCLEMWPRDVIGLSSGAQVDTHGIQYKALEDAASRRHYENLDEKDEEVLYDEARKPLLGQNISSENVGTHELGTLNPNQNKFLLASSVMATVMVIILFTLCVMGALPPWSKDAHAQLRFRQLICLYKGLIITALYVAMSCLYRFHHLLGYRKFDTSEKILLLGFFFAYNYEMYKCLGYSLIKNWNATYVFENFSTFFQEFVQVALILQLNRIHLKKHDHVVLKSSLVFLLIMTFGLWLVDSSVGIKNQAFINTFKKGLPDLAWSLVRFVLYPVFVFYRFTLLFAYAKHVERL